MHCRRVSGSQKTRTSVSKPKRADETFSEVVLRLAGERSLLELAGILSDDETADLGAAIQERRDRRSDELESLASELGRE